VGQQNPPKLVPKNLAPKKICEEIGGELTETLSPKHPVEIKRI